MNMFMKAMSNLLSMSFASLLIIFTNQTVLPDSTESVEEIKIDVINTGIKPLVKIDIIDKDVNEIIESPKSIKEQIPKDLNKRCPQWEYKFIEFGLPVEVFSYISWRESNCNENAINAKYDKAGNVIWTLNKNGSIDRGLVQINSCWKTLTKQICGTNLDGLFNVDCNLKVAKYLLENTKSGLGNWGFK